MLVQKINKLHGEVLHSMVDYLAKKCTSLYGLWRLMSNSFHNLTWYVF